MDATTNVITNLAAPAEPMYLHLSITDPEVAAAIGEAGEGRERQEFALTALRVGILSLRAARGTVDGATVRHEGDRLVSAMREQLAGFRASVDQTLSGTLRQYFDPASGLFAERVQRLVRHDGDLANVVGQQVEAARRAFDGLFDQHLGEQSELQRLLSADHDNAFPQALREQVNGALRQQGDTITADFTGTDAQVDRAINCALCYTYAMVMYGVKVFCLVYALKSLLPISLLFFAKKAYWFIGLGLMSFGFCRL